MSLTLLTDGKAPWQVYNYTFLWLVVRSDALATWLDEMLKELKTIEEHKGSAIGNHLREQHHMEPEDIAQSFRIKQI